MKTLILIRHSQAQMDGVINDFDRKLTPLGISLATVTARLLLEHIHGKACMLCSDAVRALHTAQIVAQTAGLSHSSVFTERFIYHTSPEELFQHITAMPDEFDTIIVTGHNPSLTELAADFCSIPQSLQPADAVVINFPVSSWAEPGFECTCRFVSPYKTIF